jgi:hypothetical protein
MLMPALPILKGRFPPVQELHFSPDIGIRGLPLQSLELQLVPNVAHLRW